MEKQVGRRGPIRQDLHGSVGVAYENESLSLPLGQLWFNSLRLIESGLVLL